MSSFCGSNAPVNDAAKFTPINYFQTLILLTNHETITIIKYIVKEKLK